MLLAQSRQSGFSRISYYGMQFLRLYTTQINYCHQYRFYNL